MDKKTEDLQREVEERRDICRVLFNRCFTVYGGMCQFCNLVERCEKERSVLKNIDDPLPEE